MKIYLCYDIHSLSIHGPLDPLIENLLVFWQLLIEHLLVRLHPIIENLLYLCYYIHSLDIHLFFCIHSHFLIRLISGCKQTHICFLFIIDREYRRDTISVYFVFVTVILYYRPRYYLGLFCFCYCYTLLFIYLLFRQIVILCHTVSQKLTIISPSNFLCVLSNVWRRADAKIRWPLRMTLTRDLDLTINVHFGSYLSTCWTEHLQIFTHAS